MTEIAFNAWHKAGDIQMFESQSPDVCEGGKVAQVMGAECLGHEPSPLLHDSDFLDEMRSALLIQLRQRLQLVPEDEGVVEVWDRGEVPGATGQRTRFECVEVAGSVGDVGDDHFRDVIWEGAGRFMHGRCLGMRVAEQAVDAGFTPTPSDPYASREVYPYGENDAKVRAV
jgi:hypothetical protein